METENLTYRPFEEQDVPGLLRLWEEESGWGALDEATWRKWFVDTPYGPCLLIVAIDAAGEVAGQMVFVPAVLNVNGESYRALRLSSPVLRKDIRRSTMRHLNHPAIRLFSTGMDAAAHSGYDLIYAIPERAWLPFFRLDFTAELFTSAEFECVARPLTNDASLKTSTSAVAERVVRFGEDFETLCDAVRKHLPMPCGVDREPKWLQWRHGGHAVVAVRECSGGSLLGYASFRKHDGLLMDAIARTPDRLEEVLALALAHVASTPSMLDEGVTAVKAMQTPALAPALDALGFEPDPYRFAFVSCTLSPALPRETVAPEQWYVMPGD